MEDVTQKVGFILLLCASVVNGYAICDGIICRGTNAYCCLHSDGNVGCCWNTYVYQLWWFWMIWITLFFLILACSLACWRRRRAQYRYVVMSNSEYPSYGTVVHTRNDSTTYTTPPGYHPTAAQVGTAPVGPPGYTASEKPPAYSS